MQKWKYFKFIKKCKKWKYFKFIKKCKNGNTLSSSKNAKMEIL